MEEESSLPPVFNTESKKVYHNDGEQDVQIDALQNELIDSLEAVHPRIESLEETLESLIKQSEKSSQAIGYDILTEVDRIQPRKPQIHENCINLTRKIQAIGLKQQTVQTLSVPKQMRPTHDSFTAFKEDFDSSLKNIASLSRSLTDKFDILGTTFDSVQYIPQMINDSIQETNEQMQKNKENSQNVSHVKSTLYQSILSSQQALVQQFDQKIGLAEAILNQLDEKAANRVDSDKMKATFKNEKDNAESSINNLMIEIKKATESQLDEMTKKIEDLNAKTKKEIKLLQCTLEKEFNEMKNVEVDESVLTEAAEIEKEKEISELEVLIERFDALSAKLKNMDNRSNAEGFEDHKGIWENRNVVFRCYNNGFFEILDEQ